SAHLAAAGQRAVASRRSALERRSLKTRSASLRVRLRQVEGDFFLSVPRAYVASSLRESGLKPRPTSLLPPALRAGLLDSGASSAFSAISAVKKGFVPRSSAFIRGKVFGPLFA